MKGAYRDPVDHSRTTQPHAGESFIDTLWLPGLLAIALGVVSIAGCIVAVASGHFELLAPLGLLTAALMVAGFALITAEHQRVNRVERRWRAAHPDGPPQLPAH